MGGEVIASRDKYPWSGACCLLVASAVVCHCAPNEPEPAPQEPCPELDAGTPVDPTLAAFLGKARAAHHSADILEDQQKLEEAIQVLSKLTKSQDLPDRPEAREVAADTRARLADLESRLGRFEAAAAQVRAGMALVTETTYFRGHLFEVQGLVAERHAKQLREQGQTDQAKRLEERALEAFERSMDIQQQVIDKNLGAEQQ